MSIEQKPGPANSSTDKTLADINACIDELCKNAGEVLAERCKIGFIKLSKDEVLKFSNQGQHPWRLARTLMCACHEVIQEQFSAEAILPAIKSVKRILKNRY